MTNKFQKGFDMPDQAAERVFQNDIIQQMLANVWQLGQPEKYIGEKWMVSW